MNLKLLKKLRGKSFAELRTRGRQAATQFAEQINAANKLPSDAEFFRLFRADAFGGDAPDAARLLADLQNKSDFLALCDKAEISIFRQRFPASAAAIVERAERIAANKFDLLGFQNLDFGSPIDWRFEPIANVRSPLKHWTKFNDLDTDETGDFKIVWELNRHQHFFWLGAAYRLTDDERFARVFAEHLTNWIEQNPPKMGVNWMSSLEIGLRAISWLWAFRFFRFSPALTADIYARALKLLYLQLRHVEQFLSTFYSPNTHLTGEALALYYAGAMLPEFGRAAIWRALGKRILLAELDRQFYADGVYFEQSTWYHRYTVEFYQHFLLLGDAIRDFDAGERRKIVDKLRLALDFMLHTTRPDGTTPLVGDDDGGRMLPLGTARANDFRQTLAIGAAQLARGDYKFAAGNNAETVFWLFGAAGLKKFDDLKASAPPQRSRFFDAGGYFATRSDWTPDADFLLFDCGQHGALSGAHAHADALMFEFAAGGKPVLIDAGAYTYHESSELRDYFRSTAAHNTITIDKIASSEPANKFAWKSAADAQATNRIQHQRFDFIVAAHNGFTRTLDSRETIAHERSILFLPGDYTVLLDEIKIAGAHDYESSFHFAPQMTAEIASENSIVCRESENPAGEILKIFAFGANGAWRVVDDFAAPCYGSRVRSATAKFAAAGAGDQRFVTFLLPAEIVLVAEKTASNGGAFAIESENFCDWLICANDSGANAVIENNLIESDFDLAWARCDKQTNRLLEAILIGGKRFCFRGAAIFDQPCAARFAYARSGGDGELRFDIERAESES